MNSREAVEYLFGLKEYGMKEGFDRTLRLLDELGNPHEEFETVQVGGTNGKGSVARMVESCLMRDRRAVGLYTSPHMVELGERVRVDGEKMRRKRIAGFVERVRPV
ncbi:MAG: dihydropteroate synthase, partial [Halobacteria archaeon]|nr:dihydropteroate synthase [Halobacteria archaeon]